MKEQDNFKNNQKNININNNQRFNQKIIDKRILLKNNTFLNNDKCIKDKENIINTVGHL